MSHALIAATFTREIADSLQAIATLDQARGERFHNAAHMLALLAHNKASKQLALGTLATMVNEVRQAHADLIDLRERDVTDGADRTEHLDPAMAMRLALRRLQDAIKSCPNG